MLDELGFDVERVEIASLDGARATIPRDVYDRALRGGGDHAYQRWIIMSRSVARLLPDPRLTAAAIDRMERGLATGIPSEASASRLEIGSRMKTRSVEYLQSTPARG